MCNEPNFALCECHTDAQKEMTLRVAGTRGTKEAKCGNTTGHDWCVRTCHDNSRQAMHNAHSVVCCLWWLIGSNGNAFSPGHPRPTIMPYHAVDILWSLAGRHQMLCRKLCFQGLLVKKSLWYADFIEHFWSPEVNYKSSIVNKNDSNSAYTQCTYSMEHLFTPEKQTEIGGKHGPCIQWPPSFQICTLLCTQTSAMVWCACWWVIIMWTSMAGA